MDCSFKCERQNNKASSSWYRKISSLLWDRETLLKGEAKILALKKLILKVKTSILQKTQSREWKFSPKSWRKYFNTYNWQRTRVQNLPKKKKKFYRVIKKIENPILKWATGPSCEKIPKWPLNIWRLTSSLVTRKCRFKSQWNIITQFAEW